MVAEAMVAERREGCLVEMVCLSISVRGWPELVMMAGKEERFEMVV